MSTPLSEVLRSEADDKIIEEPETTEEAVIEPEVEDTVEATEKPTEAAPTAEKPQDDRLEKLERELHAFKTKALDETNKRQALQKQLEQEKIERPDAYTDPDKAIEYANQQTLTKAEQRFLNYAFESAQDKWPDFLEKQDIFFDEMAVKNPELLQQAMKQADPYKFIYNQAKNFNEFKDVGSVDDYRKKVEADLRAKIEAEYADKYKKQVEQKITDSIPSTLANATAAGGTGSKGYNGPTPLSSILKR